MNRQRFILVVVSTGLLGSLVSAHQVSYLVDAARNPAPGEVAYQSTRFSIYIDPLKTNWAAWGRTPVTQEVAGVAALDATAEPTLVRDLPMVVSVIDPWGQRSKTLVFGRHDAAGEPVGQQALLIGKRELTPSVMRFDAGGNPILLAEEGVLDPFIAKGGEGYYTFNVTYEVPADQPFQPHGPLYLVMDVVEGYRQKPPHTNMRPGGMWGDLPDGSDNSGSGNGSSGFFGPGFNDDDDNDGDDDNNGNNPNFPTNPPDFEFPPPLVPGGPEEPGPEEPEPVIPEPGTIMLIGLGTAMAAAAQRRRLFKSGG